MGRGAGGVDKLINFYKHLKKKKKNPKTIETTAIPLFFFWELIILFKDTANNFLCLLFGSSEPDNFWQVRISQNVRSSIHFYKTSNINLTSSALIQLLPNSSSNSMSGPPNRYLKAWHNLICQFKTSCKITLQEIKVSFGRLVSFKQ